MCQGKYTARKALTIASKQLVGTIKLLEIHKTFFYNSSKRLMVHCYRVSLPTLGSVHCRMTKNISKIL